MATKVKAGIYDGQPIQFSDGPVSKALGWDSFDDILADGRPVKADLIDRMKRDHPKWDERLELLEDTGNLVYVHIQHGMASLGHVFHASELEEA